MIDYPEMRNDLEDLEQRAAKYANSVKVYTACFKHAIAVDGTVVHHEPDTCPRCKEEREAAVLERIRERLRHALKIRRFCLRVRILGLVLMAVPVIVLPWYSLIATSLGIVVLAFGVPSDLRAIATCTRELDRLTLPPAQLVSGSD